jgi:hypothetical protein
MCDTDKVVKALTGENEELRQRIILDVGRFTVPLFAIGNSGIELAGTGTLFAYRGSNYILTATHVWKEKLRSASEVGIGIVADLTNRFSVEARSLVAVFPSHPAAWDRFGPDIAFLKIPAEYVGSISARKPFYSPAVDETFAPTNLERIEVCVLMGTPYALGTFSPLHADVQVNGRFIVDQIPYSEQNGQDYFDIEIDTSPPGTPKTWGGVSGGGLWVVHVYCQCLTGKIEWSRSLQGLAFWEDVPGNDRVLIRCHGPKSIGAAFSLIQGAANTETS